MRRFVVLDAEAVREPVSRIEERHRLRVAVAQLVVREASGSYRSEKTLVASRHEEIYRFLEECTSRDEPLYVFAHNAAYDTMLLRLVPGLSARGWRLTRWVLDAPPFLLRFERGRRVLKIACTLSLFPASLRTVGEWTGTPKADMPHDDAPLEAWARYCLRDVEVLRDALLRLMTMAEHELGGMASTTLAGLAWRLWRHRFMPCEVFVHRRAEALAMERWAYYGGRCEALFLGTYRGPVFQLDVRSMYPAVMSTAQLPARLWGLYRTLDVGDLWRALERHCVIAEVQVDTDYPVLPVRRDDSVVFPTGRFWTVACTPELRLLRRYGLVTDVRRVAVYEPAPLFRDYVAYGWKRRQQALAAGDVLGARLWKGLLNSVYGKTGQKGRELLRLEDADPAELSAERVLDAETGKVQMLYTIGGGRWLAVDAGESQHSCPAIAAHITSEARVRLWRLMETAGLDEVLYVSVDSLVVTEKGFARLRHLLAPDRLGGLHVERTGTQATIWGVRQYDIDGAVKIAGLPRNYRRMDDGAFEGEQWLTWRYLLRRGDAEGPVVRRVRWEPSHRYEKGIITETGRVLPPRLSGSEWDSLPHLDDGA